MNKLLLCTLVVVFFALFFAVAFAEPTSTTPTLMAPTETTSIFSLVVTCENLECAITKNFGWKPPQDVSGSPIWSAAHFYVVSTSFSNGQTIPAPFSFSFDQTTDAPDADGFYISPSAFSFGGTGTIHFHVFGTVKFTSPQYVSGASTDGQNVAPSVFKPILSENTAPWAYAEISHQWVDDLLAPVVGDAAQESPTNIDFSPTSVAVELDYINVAQNGAKFTISFPQLESLPLASIDISLSGSNYFWVSLSDAGSINLAQFCQLNGLPIVPTILSNNTISIPIDASVRSSTNDGQLLSVTCGDASSGFSIISQSTLEAKFNTLITTDGQDVSFSERIIVVPRYSIAGTSTVYPSRGNSYSLSAAALTATSNINIVPVMTHIDQRDWTPESDLNYASGIISIFEVNFATAEEMSLPLDISVDVSGIEFNISPDFVKDNGNPRLFIEIEPDYMSSELSNYNPNSVTYVLPINPSTSSTPILNIPKGFLCGYTGTAPSTIFKRFVRVSLPLNTLHTVKSFPVTTTLLIRQISASSMSIQADDIKFTAFPRSILTSATRQTNEDDWDQRVYNVQRSTLGFDISPRGSSLAYDTVVAQYIGIRYRLKSSSGAVNAVSCSAEYEYCYQKNTRSNYSGVRTCRNNVCCQQSSDDGVVMAATALSQHRVDLDVHRSDNESPSKRRTFSCSGVGLSQETPLVLDFSDIDPTSATISADFESDARSSTTYNAYGDAGLGELVVSSVYNENKLIGYRETYSVSDRKKRLTTGEIVALALIPVYLIVIALIVIAVIFLVKKC